MKIHGLHKHGLEDSSCIVGNRSLRREAVEAHPHLRRKTPVTGALRSSGQRSCLQRKKNKKKLFQRYRYLTPRCRRGQKGRSIAAVIETSFRPRASRCAPRPWTPYSDCRWVLVFPCLPWMRRAEQSSVLTGRGGRKEESA